MGTKLSTVNWTIIRAWLVLPHAVPILFVLLATAAFAFVATDGNPGAAPLASLLVAMLGGQLAVGATNEIVDVELDRISKPHKPLPSGLVSRRGAFSMVATGLALMVIGSLRFSLLAGLLCGLGTGIGITYSIWFKRTVWSWLPYVLAIPLLPVWVWVALASPPAAMMLLYPIAVPALIAVHIAQSIPDLDGDSRAGIRNLTVYLGDHRARLACWILMGVSVSIAMLSSLSMTASPLWCWVAGGGAFGLVGTNIWAWRRDRKLGQQTCFPLMAAAVVLIGLGWTISSLA
jgi:4-hydroxybenzoate polyprenyltransferase